LCDESREDERGRLRETSEEYEMLARTLPRVGWLGFIIPFFATALTIYGSFFTIPHFDVNDKSLGLFNDILVRNSTLVFSILLFLSLAPLLFLSRSMRCKQALLCPDTLRGRWQDSTLTADTGGWDISHLEKEAFRQTGTSAPREPRGYAWLHGLTVLGYILCFGVLVLLWFGTTATLILLAATAVLALIIGFATLSRARKSSRTQSVP
jgi:hypothetical protein